MAAPQVAGLAAYIWALNPQLSSEDVVGIIQKTAYPPEIDSSCDTQGAPVIDAYAAVLAVDDYAALTTISPEQAAFLAPVRLAVLDVADLAGAEGSDDAFDERDLALYSAAYDSFDEEHPWSCEPLAKRPRSRLRPVSLSALRVFGGKTPARSCF